MTIVIGSEIFQLQHARPSGIHRMWSEVIGVMDEARDVGTMGLLARNGSRPSGFPGVVRQAPAFSWSAPDLDVRSYFDDAKLYLPSYYTLASDDVPSAVVVYDLIPEEMGWPLTDTEWAHRIHAITGAEWFFSISQTTTELLMHYYSIPREKILRFEPGVNHRTFYPLDDDEREYARRYFTGGGVPYVLVVGSPSEYKHPQGFMLELERHANRTGYAILWPGGNTRRLSPRELRMAYGGAIALVTPSRCEGFNLPVIEAMACGCPVIASDIPIHREVGLGAALYFEPDRFASYAETFAEVCDPGSEVRQHCRDAGHAVAGGRSWETSVRQLCAGIDYILA